MAPSLLPRAEMGQAQHASEPLVGVVMSVLLCFASITILSIFLTQRSLAIKVWRRLPFVVWLVFAIYIDSYLFVFATALLQFAFGVNTSIQICDGAILLCLVCYLTTKVLIYLFLVEKVHIIRGTKKSRMRSKLYIFNSFGMLGVYVIVGVLNFIFRITRMEGGQCIIGMQRLSMIPLISFDAVVNVYLTILFLIPLKNLYTFKNFAMTPANIRLRSVAIRTFVGAFCTLISSIVNLTVLMALNGEPGWVCLMCCNSDILFSAAVIQWVTSRDNAGTESTSSASRRNQAQAQDNERGPQYSPNIPPSQKHVFDDVGEISLDARSAASDKISDESERTDRKQRVGVVVTTTIRRESKPGTPRFEEMGIEERPYAAGAGSRNSEPIGPGFMARATTTISGGSKR